MKAIITHKEKNYTINLSQPITIAIPIRGSDTNVTAWYLSPPVIKPVKDGAYTGSVAKGAPTNFNTITFNPHAHGTHTECVGHITKTPYSIYNILQQFFFTAVLITLSPEPSGDDYVISGNQLQQALGGKTPEAVIIRTLPNDQTKYFRQYSHTNPPYLLETAAIYLREAGVSHLLVDLPSIDKEKDEGKLLAHKAFWNSTGKIRTEATITELIYIPNTVKDGNYLLNMQVAPFENDAAPSRPVLYVINEPKEPLW